MIMENKFREKKMGRILLFTPMYNCEKQIVRVLGQMTRAVGKYIDEWIIVNNQSTDNGEQAVLNYIEKHDLPIRVKLLRNNENYGLGGSHKVAFQYAIDNEFDYVMVFHGDDQGNINDILPIIENCEYEKYDCILGARFMKGSSLIGYSKFRTIGNIIYNLLFSICIKRMVFDLGSGLNMYNVNSLKNRFYLRYRDDLMFNYCMILGQSYYNLEVKFFPISWREDDQISNVRMMNQAVTVLTILFQYCVNRDGFVEGEHRNRIFERYEAQEIITFKPRENL